MRTPRLGFIGIGLMGEAMTLRLLEQGFDVSVWNREPERLDTVLAHGARVLSSPAEVAAHCDVVLMCVLDDAAVQACIAGQNGVIHAAEVGARLVVDFSTISPETTRQLAAQVRSRAGMGWVDAPVSGGPQAARAGSLTIMTGGSPEDMALARTVFDALGQKCTLMGPVGAGQTAKIINQAIVGVGFALMSEAVVLAEASGIDAAQLPACLQGGFADSVLLQALYPRILARAFDPPIGYARQLSKDMDAVLAFAEEVHCDLPVVREAAGRFSRYVYAGAAMADSASLIRLYEVEAGKEQGNE